jgi:hypothetical protein
VSQAIKYIRSISAYIVLKKKSKEFARSDKEYLKMG